MSYTAGQKLRASQMSVYVCTSSTHPTGHSGQLIWETDTGDMLLYDGTNWIPMGPTGAVGGAEAFYASTGQTIPTATDTTVAFATAGVTTPLVTRATSGAGHSFTLNRFGVWAISTTVRWNSPSSSSGQVYTGLFVNGSAIAAQGGGWDDQKETHSVSMTKRFGVGDVILVDAFQNCGSSVAFDTGNSGVRISLCWLHS